MFKEADFPTLHLNDIEDMFLLYYQNKLHHLDGNVSTDLAAALYRGVKGKDFYTIFYKPRDVIYEIRTGKRCLMREDEVCKFGDATNMKVRDKLKYRLNNFRMGYTKDMPRRPWSDKDKRRAESMVKVIEKTLHKRRIIRSLECYVGERNLETDYRLLTRTD
ncbi:hypothetical protein Tco_1087009 [Tanacetum coccineum]